MDATAKKIITLMTSVTSKRGSASVRMAECLRVTKSVSSNRVKCRSFPFPFASPLQTTNSFWKLKYAQNYQTLLKRPSTSSKATCKSKSMRFNYKVLSYVAENWTKRRKVSFEIVDSIQNWISRNTTFQFHQHIDRISCASDVIMSLQTTNTIQQWQTQERIIENTRGESKVHLYLATSCRMLM